MDAFWLALLMRAVASATVVVVATVAAEASGPFWGGLIVSLPIAAGPAYVMLALQQGASFIAASALSSFAVNAATFVFLGVLDRLAVLVHWGWAIGGSLAVWFVIVLLIRGFHWQTSSAIMLNLGALLTGLVLTRSMGHEARPPRVPLRRRWFELPLRAAMVGLLVGAVVTGSRALGPMLTGTAAVFPVALTSLALLMLPRVGRGEGAAIMVSALRAMPGLALALLTLHLTAEPFGVAASLLVALLPSLGWSALLMAARWRKGVA